MIAIRPARPADLARLRALETACFGRDAWGEQALEGELAGVPDTRCVLVAEDADTSADSADSADVADVADIAEIDTCWGTGADTVTGTGETTIAGYASLLAVAATADVQRIAVRPDRRREGIGRALLDALLAQARDRGCAEALLEVRHDNAAALAMYEAIGFEQIARRRGYYHGVADALVLRLAPLD
ncbi:ribosomal protein S18-alanine N-acetyltransferase [Actinopolymorpha sp. NPDC004070]|uniref:ribosomal protein S18-alanine N-acetyltransferase n=1 Tax=Actinopolymorpha sp. NPDC004070 TaxID=3154548 RepID=UPI0033AFB496